MGICVRSSFAGSFDQFIVDTTPSDIESDDHGEDPDGVVEFPFLLVFSVMLDRKSTRLNSSHAQ